MLVRELRRAVRVHRLLEPRQPVLVAVSGGVDSMVLLHALCAEGYAVTAAHADHGLRGTESAGDRDHVLAFCAERGIPCVTSALPVMDQQAGSGRSVEMVARDLRYAWLNEVATRAGSDTIAVAHHRDDSIETLLLHLLRGTGIAGWAGIPRRTGHVVRPLLDVDRAEILRYARLHHVPFREDSSNTDPSHLRNRIRHELLPLMEDIRPGARRTMARSLNVLGDLVKEWTARSAPSTEDHILFTALTSSIAPRLLLHQRLRPLGFHPEQLEDLLRAIEEGRVGAEFRSPDHRVILDRDMLFITPLAPGSAPSYSIGPDLALPADAPVRLSYGSADDVVVPGSVHLDPDRLVLPLVLRPWKPGDRFQPHGMTGSKLVSDLLIDAKVPRHQKESTYVLCSSGTIVWVVGHRTANGFVAAPGSRSVVRGEVCATALPDMLPSASSKPIP